MKKPRWEFKLRDQAKVKAEAPVPESVVPKVTKPEEHALALRAAFLPDMGDLSPNSAVPKVHNPKNENASVVYQAVRARNPVWDADPHAWSIWQAAWMESEDRVMLALERIQEEMPNRLPRRPGNLISHGLTALYRASQDAKVVIQFDKKWLHYMGNGVYHVGFAGCTMLDLMLEVPERKVLVPEDFKPQTQVRKLYALEAFSRGQVAVGAERMGFRVPVAYRQRVITPYAEDPRAFRKDMRALALQLIGLGL